MGLENMAQYFIALSALTEDLGWLPSTQMAAHHHLLTLVPENPAPSTDLCGHQTCMSCTYVCMQENSHTHKTNNQNK